MCIICFTGSHSTGKSTLVEFFRGKEGYVCLDSCTRTTISDRERRIDGVEDLGLTQIRMLDQVTKRMADIVKMNAENPDKIFCMDRSVLDFIGYSRAFNKRGLLSDEYLKQIEEKCDRLWEYIDVFFYLPIEFQIVNDNVRSLDEDLRQMVDKEILDQILWNKVRAVKLTGPVLVRVKKVQEVVNEITRSNKSSD